MAMATGPIAAGRITYGAYRNLSNETAARLLQESRKAREEGESYAAQTVRQAANAVERRRREQPSKSELSSSGAVEARHQRDG